MEGAMGSSCPSCWGNCKGSRAIR
ncbi:hypothetical protein XH83_25455 [Bradyrhizobium sp. CCBAU 53351]|nr:hypothetical protein XH83_25455 [Bradyrhizobium sp. CCBAU 53351]